MQNILRLLHYCNHENDIKSGGVQVEYQQAMNVLSQCGLGAVLVSSDSTIISVNEEGNRLLHGDGKLEGKLLLDIAAPLCIESEKPIFANVVFGEYLVRCPTPELSGIPSRFRVIVFRNAVNDACHDMLISVLNQIGESVILCDAEGRVYLLNDAAVKMDSIVTQDVLGEDVKEVYRTRDGSDLTIPQVIENKRPILNYRQYYTTRYGKDVDIVSNNFPITQNGQLLGAFSVMEDWSKIDDLHKQIIDLQDRLTGRISSTGHKRNAVLTAKYKFRDIVYISDIMSSVAERCKQVAKTDSSVMIYGETGTGKELFAQSIHNASKRTAGSFLAINCAAIPENLLEALLFGTEKGAYTGAECRAGLFEQANFGTLLLDEINSMNINLQSKLLRVLQDGMIRRVGGISEIHVDVRVLSNINLPPYQAIEENKLRRDLFYRLGVVNINVPPLRERKEDIALLAKSFIIQYNKKLVKNVKNIDKTTLEEFYAYSWPGNVRELQHAIEHAMNIMPDNVSVITPNYIPEHIISESTATSLMPSQALPTDGPLNNIMKDVERRTICGILRKNDGNISKSARALGMSRQNLQYRIKRYKIDVEALLHNPTTFEPSFPRPKF